MRLRHVLCILLAAAAAVGCSSDNEGKIAGTKWKSEATAVKGQSLPAGALSLEFAHGGGLAYRIGPRTFTGKYVLGAGDAVTLHLDRELAGRRTHLQRISVAGERLTLTDSDGTRLTFARAE